MELMNEDNYSQQELFEQEKYISDLIEKKSDKKKSSINIVFGASLISSGIVLSFLFLFGLFDEEEIVIPEPVTITETVTEKELVMPRVDSTEIVSIAELATKTIVQVQVGNMSEDGEFLPNGGGSGVVISADGLIMTNHHVIDNSTQVRVVFEDGRMYESEIIGSDRLTDIGLLKISASNLVPISIGNSEALKVGDLAVAIGHPLTLGAAPTVTTGVVSALERRLDVGGEAMNSGVTLFGLIQTDAPITRGSSGGALINNNGEFDFDVDFIMRASLFIMDKDGKNIKRISKGRGVYGNPVWSPRGDLIAFVKNIKPNFYIGVMDTNGENERIVVQDFSLESPAWSPNGRYLIFYLSLIHI